MDPVQKAAPHHLMPGPLFQAVRNCWGQSRGPSWVPEIRGSGPPEGDMYTLPEARVQPSYPFLGMGV